MKQQDFHLSVPEDRSNRPVQVSCAPHGGHWPGLSSAGAAGGCPHHQCWTRISSEGAGFFCGLTPVHLQRAVCLSFVPLSHNSSLPLISRSLTNLGYFSMISPLKFLG